MVKNKNFFLMVFVLSSVCTFFSCIGINKLLIDNIASGIHYEKEVAPFNIFMIILFWIYFSSVVYISRNKQSIVDIFLLFYLVLYFLPFVAFSASIKTNTVYIIYTNLFFVSLICIRYITIKCPVKLKNDLIRFSQSKYVKKIIYVMMLCAITAIVFAIAVYINGFKLSFSLSGIYTIRANYKLRTTFLINVIKNTFGWFLVPILLLREAKSKRFITVAWLLFIELLLYSLGRDKMYLLLIFAAICFYVLKDIDAIHLSVVIIAGIITALLISLLMYKFLGGNLFYTLVLRRLFVTPEHISNYCFDFFSRNSKIFWRQDVFLIDKFFQPVYEKPYVSIISDNYFEGIIPNPTTGILADSYINFGWLGLIVYPMLLLLLLSILNHYSSMLDNSEKNLFVLIFTLLILDNSITGSDIVCMMILILLLLQSIPIMRRKFK